MRHIAINMLRNDTTRKASIRRKTKIATMEISYLEQILASAVGGTINDHTCSHPGI
ncbi:hypothetical protein VAE115_310013 [Vibrio aestuarianus]|uniref:Uncharacterized protein n=1 Tax=Vibrio aestuarianus TaxID=28171 RepID=A0ABN8TUF2_9VIBR|nr:hypothetical protein VAE032_260013 [Vibrio aestuarianus]CAH8190476.1 hypothetical protein VAE128_450013 [Vibrio aestuarianus]CAH8190873.1 hypothetical protein VAE115_310013 [Vibrio aestuarianus]CAH8200688.1 hypothetical protein VAE016_360012 [Vibrio aestuarianus]CAH8221851.1 hypothetical protein VAE063_930012 [Vibrio aestuarianus]